MSRTWFDGPFVVSILACGIAGRRAQCPRLYPGGVRKNGARETGGPRLSTVTFTGSSSVSVQLGCGVWPFKEGKRICPACDGRLVLVRDGMGTIDRLHRFLDLSVLLVDALGLDPGVATAIPSLVA